MAARQGRGRRLTRLAVGAALACRPDAPRRAPPAAGPPPTADRPAAPGPATRPTRPTRPASALHVLAAPATASAAGVPLPAPLRVELFDSRGRPAAGAAVEWRVRSGGGRVTPEHGTTDERGVAAAEWRPGPTADPQTVAVGVPGVGEVELRTSVPVATTLVLPRAVTLWPGDGAALRVELADAAGHALAGGAPRWESSDSSTVRVSASGVVTARAAGVARITASVPGASPLGAAAVTVLPVVAGRAVAPAGPAPPPPRLRLVVRAAGRVDSADLTPAGRFALRLPAPLDDTAEVMLTPVGGGSYAPLRLLVASPRELGALDLVLVPDEWPIAAGAFAGRTLPVSVAAPLARAGDGTRFWRLERLGARAVPVGWRAAELPVPVVVERGGGAAALGAADSARFWGVARALERDLGTRLFTPAPSTSGEDEGGTIRVRVDPALRDAGYTVVGWDASGAIGGATVTVRSAALLGDPSVTAHELLHALGIGHTRSWSSLMGGAGTRAPALTAEDAAYVQLLLAIRRAIADGTRAGEAPSGIAPTGGEPVGRTGGRPVGIP